MSTHNLHFEQKYELEMCQYDTDAPAQGHPHPHTGCLQKYEVGKRAITPIIIGRFYPKSNLTIFYIIYLGIKYESNTQINLFKKKYRKENIF